LIERISDVLAVPQQYSIGYGNIDNLFNDEEFGFQ